MEYKGRKYRKLYTHLCDLTTREWITSFGDIEAIIGDKLPPSARLHRASWANDVTQTRARAWIAAGWKTVQVDMDAETLLFRREAIYTPDGHPLSPADALDTLDQLQTALGARGVDLAGWAQNLRTERRAIER